MASIGTALEPAQHQALLARRACHPARMAKLRRQIGSCWRGAENLSQPERVSVVLRFQLTPSGELDGDVTLVSPEADEVSAVAISRATDAILNCAPYNLPKEHYHIWEDVEVTIGPPKNNLVS